MDDFSRARAVETKTKARDFMRYATALAMGKGSHTHAVQIFENRWPRSKNIDTVRKAAVAPGNTTDSVWAGPLAPLNSLASEFVAMVRPATVIGRMTGFRRVPFNIKFPRQTSGASVGWVGQGRPAIVTKLGFESDTFNQSKIAGIVVISTDLARSADPAAEALVHDDLIATVAQFSDWQFLDPTVAEVADVSPASVTYGAPAITASGITADAARDDLLELIGLITTDMVAPYFVMKRSTALHLASLQLGSGDAAFPHVGVNGGNIWGITVLVSDNTPAAALTGSPPVALNRIILIDAADIMLAEGDIEIDASEHACIQMDSTPTNPPVATTVMTSLWQMNLIGFLATRFIRWKRRRDGSVAVLNGVPY